MDAILQAPVVQKVDSAIQWMNLYPVNSAIGFLNTYPLEGDLSIGQRYPMFEQPGPGNKQCSHQAAALRDSRKKKLKWRIKTKKMRPLGRKGKLRVKRTQAVLMVTLTLKHSVCLNK